MKVNKLLIKLFIILSIFSVTVFAKDEMAGTLKSGEKIIIKPKSNYAFSVTKSRGMFSSHASYNLSLVNNGEIVYEDKNLVDDVYLVFHDDVLAGDRMHIEVNRGYFDYRLTPLLKLPTVVKNALEPEVIEKAKKRKKEAKKPKKKTHPRKTVSAPVAKQKREEHTPVQDVFIAADVETAQQGVDVPPLKTDISYETPVGDAFFEKFTKIFKALVEKFSLGTLNSSKTEKSEKKNETIESKNPINKRDNKVALENFNDNALKRAATIEQKDRFSDTKRGIKAHFDDSDLQNSARASTHSFALPKRGLSENFDDRALQEHASVSKKVFNTPKEIALNSNMPTYVEKKPSTTSRSKPDLYQESLSSKVEQVPNFKSPEPVATEKLQTEAKAEDMPHFSTPKPKSEPKELASKQEQVPVNTYYKAQNQTALGIDDRTESYPDTGYKEEYKELQAQQSRVESKPVEEDKSLPQNSAPRSEDAGEKLVITKIIEKDKPEADPFAGRVLGRMDDRVLGNGYDGAATSAKLGVRVTKNKRAVSAWIEVFKDGTKQRVKTFYTSKGRKTKHVKLPAGEYMLRATYRTRDAKQQKTIKGIHLAEGDNVNKSIAFYDGKLRVVARRGDSPLYVKVVAYKSGTRKRVAYDFSSRTSGVATLSLASGTYDIEVIDHKNNRTFDAIRIRAGKTNTINADF